MAPLSLNRERSRSPYAGHEEAGALQILRSLFTLKSEVLHPIARFVNLQSAARPDPSKSMVDGSGTGAGATSPERTAQAK